MYPSHNDETVSALDVVEAFFGHIKEIVRQSHLQESGIF